MLPSLVSRYLVPDTKAVAPEGFSTVTESLRRGLPHAIDLSASLRMLVIVPTGVAAYWRESEPDALISSAAPEQEPQPLLNAPARDYTATVPVTLLLQNNGRTAAAAPLKVGLAGALPQNGEAATLIELAILDWAIYAGTLQGAGEFGSFLNFAWRLSAPGVAIFSEPVMNPVFLARQPPERRIASETGRRVLLRNRRFSMARVISQ